MKRSSGGRAPAAAAAKETESPTEQKRRRPSEAETAAQDAAKEVADIEESTEAQSATLPAVLLERRLSKSTDTIKQLEKDRTAMQKKVDELIEAQKNRNE